MIWHFTAGAGVATLLIGLYLRWRYVQDLRAFYAKPKIQRIGGSPIRPISLRVKQPDGTTRKVMWEDPVESTDPKPERQEDPPKAIVRVADWGEDFTGEDDVLARYRWTVEVEGKILMLGNEMRHGVATSAAVLWVSRHCPIGTTIHVWSN